MTKRQIAQQMHAEMSEFETTGEIERILNELFYTADETGIIPFSIKPPDIDTVYRLVKLAERYSENKHSIEHFRM